MILITGGLGFIGTHTTRAVLDLGAPALPASRHPKSSSLIPSGVGTAVVDCTDPQSLSALGRQHRITTIVHLAAAPLGGTPLDDLQQNTAATFAILRAAAEWDVQRVVLASTIGVYAGVEEYPWREEAPLPLASPHPIPASKKTAEILALASGLDVVVARIGGIWGPQGRTASPFIAAPALIHAAAAQRERRGDEAQHQGDKGDQLRTQPRGEGAQDQTDEQAQDRAEARGAELQDHGKEQRDEGLRDHAQSPREEAHDHTGRDGGQGGGGRRGAGGPGTVYAGDGVDILYARDCGAALALLATAPALRHRVYNVGSGRATTNAEVAAAIAAVYPEAEPALADGASSPGPLPYLDTDRLAAEGWTPQWPLERAVADYLAWLAAGHER
ncbi:NAD-dependent epimerase/dehydratase family protein [Dactylosporangium sp. McL0621]|uniref:NAD-dependent epimerase/dehydratase family protein n=1 Tax=Dactylosporangium sp. McL0621 TaxID=3415678 RepID=UPI003CF65BC9